MKKLFFLFFAISLFHHFTFAQWVQQTSGVSAGLTEVNFINQNTGWVCGNGGTILKTTNGGLNWVTQNSGVPSKPLRDIQPIDSNLVYCVGWFETILKSTDGGSSWFAVRNGLDGVGKNYIGMYFMNSNTGWITGQGSYVLRTTNGGLSFDSSFVPAIIYDVYFKDNLNGLISGETGTLFKSTNGGINWNQINVLGETAEFFELTFIMDTGWLIGTQTRKIYKTTNFGANWDSVGRITGTNSWLSSIFFSNLSTGWVCGDSGKIYKSTNGGINWYQQVVPLTVGYGPSYFINDTVGWAVGSIGTIIHTTTGGQIVGINPEQNVRIEEYSLYQNFPNPFNPETNIFFQIPKTTLIQIKIYDVVGTEITSLIDGKIQAGIHGIKWDASKYPSGIYFCRVTTEDFRETKKMILIK